MGPPLRRKRTGSVGSAKAGAVVKPQQRQFLHTQGPVAREESRKVTQILRAGNFLPGQRDNPRNGGPRGRLPLSGGDVERSETEGVGTGGMEAGGLPNRRLRLPPHRPSVRTGAPSPLGGRLFGGRRPLTRPTGRNPAK